MTADAGQPLRARLDRPWVPLALALAAHLAFVLLRLGHFGWEPSVFVCAPANTDRARSGLRWLDKSEGYDGQFFYRLALDPLASRTTDFGIILASYRHQRIGYPLAAAALSWGHPRAAASCASASSASETKRESKGFVVQALPAFSGCPRSADDLRERPP